MFDEIFFILPFPQKGCWLCCFKENYIINRCMLYWVPWVTFLGYSFAHVFLKCFIIKYYKKCVRKNIQFILIFQGTTDIEQLALVIRTLGSPRLFEWPELRQLPDYNKIRYAFVDFYLEMGKLLVTDLLFCIVSDVGWVVWAWREYGSILIKFKQKFYFSQIE